MAQVGCQRRAKSRKKTWMKENKKWLGKWDITLHDCPHAKEEIKK